MDYPSVIQFETISACNAHCSFCPHSSMDRKPQRMSLDTIDSILNQVSTFRDHLSHICPFLTNEPFADNRMPDIVRLINGKLGVPIDFFTNGSLFTESLIHSLRGTSLRSFNVSLHHREKADYEKELGINFEKTLESIHRLIDAQLGFVRLLRVPSKNDPDADAAFVDFCATEFRGIPVGISYRYNWKGDIASHQDYERTLDIICPRHSSMTITVNGEVALCCLDQNADYSLGNVHKQSLLEIYNGEKAVTYRSKTKRHSAPCNTCNMIA